MMFLFSCTDGTQAAEGIIRIFSLVKSFLTLIQIAVPIGLIIMGTIDFSKAVMASDEDKMKKAQVIFIKRIIYALLVFLVVIIVRFTMNFISGSSNDTSSWLKCWEKAR